MGREFGAKSIRAPSHPIALKYFIAVDIKIINSMAAFEDRTRLTSPDQPRGGCACRAPDQIRRRACPTETQRSTPGVASRKICALASSPSAQRTRAGRKGRPFGFAVRVWGAIASFPDCGSAMRMQHAGFRFYIGFQRGASIPPRRRRLFPRVRVAKREARSRPTPVSPQGLMSPRIGATVPARPVGGLDA